MRYSNNSKSHRVYNLTTQRIMESRNFIFNETPSRLPPPPSGEFPIKSWGHGQVGNDQTHNYITDDDILRYLRDYALVLDFLLGTPAESHPRGRAVSEPTGG